MTPYVTIDEANAYFATRLDAQAWERADDLTRQAALVTATRRIDMQRLRRRWTGPDDAPQAVKDACCEEALALISRTAEDKLRESMQAQGVTSVTIGDTSESYDLSRVSRGDQLCATAMQLLAPYRVGAAPIV